MPTENVKARKVLVTGGMGNIGATFARFASAKYDLRLVDRKPWDPAKLGEAPGECLVLNLADLEEARQACAGIDTVVHLAADPSPEADFLASLLNDNILSTYNMFLAAKEKGCQRFIFASSIHAVGAYPPDVQINAGMPVRPTSMYGVSKCFGEALAAHFAINRGLPSIAIRIGAYTRPEHLARLQPDYLDIFLHPADFNELLVQCIETPNLAFEIAHAISNNRHKRLDLTDTRRVFGYDPQYDAYEMLGILPAQQA